MELYDQYILVIAIVKSPVGKVITPFVLSTLDMG